MITAVLLAAGCSSRIGAAPDSKLLLPWGEEDEPLVAEAARRLIAAGMERVIAVVGHRADDVGRALASMDVEIVLNPDYASGLSTSIAAGIRAAPEETTGHLFVLGDMPVVAPDTVIRLCRAFDGSRRSIVVPVADGRRGNPVLFDRSFRCELLALSGDRGAGGLLDQHADCVVEVEVDDDGIFADVDTAEAYRKLRGS
jgi:molybdenum cofactor cytidylyltransferase